MKRDGERRGKGSKGGEKRRKRREEEKEREGGWERERECYAISEFKRGHRCLLRLRRK